MNLITLQQANALFSQIERLQANINQLNGLIDEAKEDKVKARIRGLDIELPKAVFKSEVNKKKTALEAELVAVQAEFDSL